jgi:hypothetical protein
LVKKKNKVLDSRVGDVETKVNNKEKRNQEVQSERKTELVD